MTGVIIELKIKILTYTDNSQPGWVRCCFSDIHKRVHYVDEKVPVITELDLTEESEYPQDGYIRCEVITTNDNVVTIDISNPFSLEDENGETIFKVFSDQIGAVETNSRK
jgi:hypothetical protein